MELALRAFEAALTRPRRRRRSRSRSSSSSSRRSPARARGGWRRRRRPDDSEGAPLPAGSLAAAALTGDNSGSSAAAGRTPGRVGAHGVRFGTAFASDKQEMDEVIRSLQPQQSREISRPPPSLDPYSCRTRSPSGQSQGLRIVRRHRRLRRRLERRLVVSAGDLNGCLELLMFTHCRPASRSSSRGACPLATPPSRGERRTAGARAAAARPAEPVRTTWRGAAMDGRAARGWPPRAPLERGGSGVRPTAAKKSSAS